MAAGGVAGGLAINSKRQKEIEVWQKLSDKHLALFMLMNEWLKIKQEGKKIKNYFEKNDYKTIAIYGMSYVGERLLDELADSEIEVRYAIDQNAGTIYSDIEVYSPDDELPEVDVVVVSAVYYYDDIYNKLIDKVVCPIVSLEDVLYELEV